MGTIDMHRLTTKLFVGCRLTQDLRIQLGQSKKWKQSRLFAGKNPKEPVEIHHDGKEYLGFFILGESTEVRQVKQTSEKLIHAIANYIPSIDFSSVHIYVFPQVFVK